MLIVSHITYPSRFYPTFSHFLYAIAKENEEGSGESAFAAIVEKIFQETGIRGVVVNNRIINVVRKKIGSLCAELKRVKKKSGGFGVKRIINKWRDQTYEVKIFYHELDKYVIEKENQDLRGKKRTLEESLANETTKRQKLEKKLGDTERSCNYLKKKVSKSC